MTQRKIRFVSFHKVKEKWLPPTALNDTTYSKKQDGSVANNDNKFKMELNHEQLFEFYSNLEKIQSQLDALVWWESPSI